MNVEVGSRKFGLVVLVIENSLFAELLGQKVSNLRDRLSVFTREREGNFEASGGHGARVYHYRSQYSPAKSGRSKESLKHRKRREDHLHIDAGIERRPVGVRDVLVLVADREAAAVAVDDLDAAAEIECEVETRGAGQRRLFVEVEEASSRLAEWLHAAIATE